MGLKFMTPVILVKAAKRVHVLLETEIKFKIIEPWIVVSRLLKLALE